MEFHEKLQELRKQRGLTQEELAQALFVSRTAISKWESGRGYPSIDSLKEISRYFSVTIDGLLSTEELMTAAEDDNSAKFREFCGLLLGIADLLTIMLVILPLYPYEESGHIASVTLFRFVQGLSWLRWLYYGLFGAQFCTGIVKVILNRKKTEKGQTSVTICSFILGVITVLFLTMARTPYAAATAFLLLTVKAVIIWQTAKK